MNLISTGDLRYSATDLSHYINCRHLTLLNKEVAYGRLDRPPITDPYFHMLTERGRRFEDKYLDFLRSSGWKLSFTGKSGDEKPSFERTLELMKSGAEIIVQARLEFDEWMGFADILRKINKKSRWGDWAYEVMDTKLARETKAGSVMQLCVYTDLLNSIQDYEPEYMYIVKPEPDGTGFVEERHRFRDYGAYFRRIRKQFLKDIASHEISDSYPDPVAYCEQCNWWIRCEKERRKDDHLVYVARMSKMHMAELHEREIKKLGQFATSPVIDWRPKRGNKTSYQRLQEQAKIQLKGRSEQRPVFEFLPMDEDFGLARLPEPDPGDVFFDIESDRYVEGGGLEYLLGFVYRDASGEFVYDRFWSNDHREEKQNFERLMDWLTVRWATYPGMYIYHFAPYEPAALKRLMTRHNSKVDELDRLLRANSFVDLHTIVRRSVRASVESYSLKDLEPFYGFERETDLKKAAWSLRAFQRNLEFGISDPLPDDTIQNIDNYNREDCLSSCVRRSTR